MTTTEELELNITIDENNLINGAIDVVKHIRPTWVANRLQFKVLVSFID